MKSIKNNFKTFEKYYSEDDGNELIQKNDYLDKRLKKLQNKEKNKTVKTKNNIS